MSGRPIALPFVTSSRRRFGPRASTKTLANSSADRNLGGGGIPARPRPGSPGQRASGRLAGPRRTAPPGACMAVADTDPFRLSSPRIFLVRIVVFLILVGFIGLILYRKIAHGLHGQSRPQRPDLRRALRRHRLGLRQVARLFREVRWVNALPRGDAARSSRRSCWRRWRRCSATSRRPRDLHHDAARHPRLDRHAPRRGREVARYLTGLLIFLGLLGTFWGLIETVGSIGGVIKSMQAAPTPASCSTT